MDHRRTLRHFGLLTPALLLMLAFFVGPLLYMVHVSFNYGWDTEHYQRIVERSVYFRVIANTFTLSAGVTLICLLLGYPLAYLLASVPARLRRWLVVPVMVPYLTSLMVRSYAWMVLLGREGLLNQLLTFFGIPPVQAMNSTFATYTGMVHVMLPMMILPLFAAMANIDHRLMAAARGLGASATMAFLRVYLPLSLPGIVAGSSLVLIVSLGFFIIPELLGGPTDQTIAALIERQVGVALNWEFAAALAMVLLAITLLLLAFGVAVRRLLRQRRLPLASTYGGAVT